MRLIARSSAALLVAALLLGASAARAADGPSAAELMDDLMWSRTPVGAPFALTDHTGKRRSDAEFRGKLMLIYFGYSYCPDVCPTDLMAIAAALASLGAEGDAVQPLFISVDPERDTPEHLADYVAAFHPRLIGLTGTAREIRKVALAFKVYYARVPVPGSEDYGIDHTGFIYLMGRDGKFLGFFPPGTPPERLVEIIRQHLAD